MFLDVYSHGMKVTLSACVPRFPDAVRQKKVDEYAYDLLSERFKGLTIKPTKLIEKL